MRRGCFILAMLLFFCQFPAGILAAADQAASDLEFDLTDLHVWTNGAVVSPASDQAKFVLTGPAGLLDDYYVYIYKAENYDLSGYHEIIFTIQNTSSSPLRFNVASEDAKRKQYTLNDDRTVLIVEKGGKMKDLLSPRYTMLEIPPGFEGEVYVSLDTLSPDVLQNIVSLGITIHIPQGEERSFLISDARASAEKKSAAKFVIEGESVLQRPLLGETIALYTVIFENEKGDAAFRLEEPLSGVSLTESGRLIIDETADSDHIEISALSSEGVRKTKEITLIDSWAKDQTIAGIKMYLPKSEELTILTPKDQFFLDERNLMIIRFTALFFAFLTGVLYLSWRRSKE